MSLMFEYQPFNILHPKLIKTLKKSTQKPMRVLLCVVTKKLILECPSKSNLCPLFRWFYPYRVPVLRSIGVAIFME
jgi:hypothetical protein